MANHINLKWRIGVLTFIVMAILFVAFNEQLEYFYDATGMSGKAPIEEVLSTPSEPKMADTTTVPKGMRLQTNAVPPWNRLYCPLAKSPLKIDGKPDDWTLHSGRFLCNDCSSERKTLSAWMHTMFDDENFYVFSRVRQPSGLKNGLKVDDEIVKGTFVQTRMITDLATSINLWRDDAGNSVMQLHYYWPSKYPRRPTKKDDDLFSAEDAIHRVDGLAQGAVMNVVEHPDQMGVDIECAIPWKLLCIDVSERPKTNTFVKMAYAAQFKPGVPTQVVQLKTDHRRRLYHTLFSASPPATPPNVEASLSNLAPGVSAEITQEQRLYKSHIDTNSHQIIVDWDNPFNPVNVGASELLVTPVSSPVSADGIDSEWPKTAEVLIAERLSQEDGAAKLKASADEEALYIYARIYDVTPDGHGSALILKVKTDSIHEIQMEQTSLQIDGKDALAGGAKLGSVIAPSHLEYSLEAIIPWNLLTADGKKPGSFAITGYASLNPKWSTAKLVGDIPVTVADGTKEMWLAARIVDAAPKKPGPIVFANNLVYDLSAGMPESLSYFNGRALRFPLGTWNPGIDVLPGSPTVDGKINDWDLTGGIFLCADLHFYHDNNAAWIHAMYDKKHLYLLYRLVDNTPMSNPSEKFYNRDDMVEFRMDVGGQVLTWAVAAIEGAPDLYSIVRLGGSKQNNPDLANTIKVAHSKLPDESGYLVEAAIPWDTLGGEKVAGDSVPMYFVARTTSRMFMSDPTKFSSVVMLPDEPDIYGSAHFREKGSITPRPCHLANGKSIPVVMRDGKPELDLSKLK